MKPTTLNQFPRSFISTHFCTTSNSWIFRYKALLPLETRKVAREITVILRSKRHHQSSVAPYSTNDRTILLCNLGLVFTQACQAHVSRYAKKKKFSDMYVVIHESVTRALCESRAERFLVFLNWRGYARPLRIWTLYKGLYEERNLVELGR